MMQHREMTDCKILLLVHGKKLYSKYIFLPQLSAAISGHRATDDVQERELWFKSLPAQSFPTCFLLLSLTFLPHVNG